MLTVAGFDLDGDVTDTEAMLKLVRGVVQEAVPRMAGRYGDVRRQGHFSRRHAPDMQVMDVSHPRQACQVRPDGLRIDTLRTALQGQSNRFA